MPYAPANAIDLNDLEFNIKFVELCYPPQEAEDAYEKFTTQLCKLYPSLASQIRKYRATRNPAERKKLEPELLASLAALPKTVEFDGCKGATALMKLESLSKDSLIPGELTRFNLSELKAIGKAALIHRKEKLTIGCDEAARARNIPPFQEMKNLFYQVNLPDGDKKYLAFHLRGDEEAEEAAIKKIIESQFGKDCSHEKADVEKFGLSTGRVNPFSLKWVQENSKIPLIQCFSNSLRTSANKYFPDELFTNIGSNYLGMTIPISSLPEIIGRVGGILGDFAKARGVAERKAYEMTIPISSLPEIIGRVGGILEDFAKARGVAERKAYEMKTVGFVGDPLFKSIMIATIQQQMCDKLGAAFPPIFGNSAEDRLAFFCNFFTNPNYYHEQIERAVNEQLAIYSPENLVCVGHTTSQYLSEGFNGKLLKIDRCTVKEAVEYSQRLGVFSTLVACSKNYAKHNFAKSAYADIKSTPCTSEVMEKIIQKSLAGSSVLSQKELDILQQDLLKLAKKESDGGKNPFVLVIGSEELGVAIKQIPNLKTTLQKAGCLLINSIDALANTVCRTLYHDVLEETRKRKAKTTEATETTTPAAALHILKTVQMSHSDQQSLFA